MVQDSGLGLTELRVDGGAAANNLLCQFQANLLDIPIRRPKVLESTALGAAYLAGLAVGYWEDREEISAHWSMGREFFPQMSKDRRRKLVMGWERAVARSKSWASPEEEG
jgi:glycerol kinase